MAFRYADTAWDGQLWETAPAITTLGKQIEKIRPGTFAGDGTAASQGHDQNNPTSDHTVWPKTLMPPGVGTVYAIDIAETSLLSIDALFEGFRRSQDARLKYAIHDQRIFSSYPTSSYPPWTWRPYSGYNAHLTHGHLSVHHTPALANDTTPWIITGGENMEQFYKDIQRNLNAAGFTDKNGDPLLVDGVWGPATKQAHRKLCLAAAKPSTFMTRAKRLFVRKGTTVIIGDPDV